MVSARNLNTVPSEIEKPDFATSKPLTILHHFIFHGSASGIDFQGYIKTKIIQSPETIPSDFDAAIRNSWSPGELKAIPQITQGALSSSVPKSIARGRKYTMLTLYIMFKSGYQFALIQPIFPMNGRSGTPMDPGGHSIQDFAAHGTVHAGQE
jgi:hypothetical protein